MSLSHIPSKCFSCRNAGLCSWSKDFEPVPGWRAEPIKLRANGRKPMEDSFKVLECPTYYPRRRGMVDG